MMINCFVINVPGEDQRRAHTTELLARHQMPFTFWDGVKGSTQDPAQAVRDGVVTEGFFTATEDHAAVYLNKIGCALSHTNLWTHYLKHSPNSDAPILVLEDDVDFDVDGDLQARVQQLIDNVPPGTDMVYLGYTAESDRCERQSDLFHHARHPRGLFAYLIWKPGARKALDAVFPMVLPIDELLARSITSGHLNALIVQPAWAIHRNLFESTIWRHR